MPTYPPQPPPRCSTFNDPNHSSQLKLSLCPSYLFLCLQSLHVSTGLLSTSHIPLQNVNAAEEWMDQSSAQVTGGQVPSDTTGSLNVNPSHAATSYRVIHPLPAVNPGLHIASPELHIPSNSSQSASRTHASKIPKLSREPGRPGSGGYAVEGLLILTGRRKWLLNSRCVLLMGNQELSFTIISFLGLRMLFVLKLVNDWT